MHFLFISFILFPPSGVVRNRLDGLGLDQRTSSAVPEKHGSLTHPHQGGGSAARHSPAVEEPVSVWHA